MPAHATSEKVPARERLLRAADELFYAEGIHMVGIDRVIERAGVAKASLYSCFGSKDELVRAYLMGRHERRVTRLTALVAQRSDPRGKILAIFDYASGVVADPTFHGCAFMNANAEAPAGGPEQEVSDLTRAWLRSLLHDHLAGAGAAHPERLARQLLQLYEGALASARLDRDPEAVATARSAAEVLLDAAGVPPWPEGPELDRA